MKEHHPVVYRTGIPDKSDVLLCRQAVRRPFCKEPTRPTECTPPLLRRLRGNDRESLDGRSHMPVGQLSSPCRARPPSWLAGWLK